MNIEVDQTYKMLHFLTPFAVYAIEHEPWPMGHPWHDATAKAGTPQAVVRVRPKHLRNPEWAKWMGSEEDQRPESMYIEIQNVYREIMATYHLTGVEPSQEDGADALLHWMAAFFVFRGFVLSKRQAWNFARYLPPHFLELMPEDLYGPTTETP